MEDLGKRIYNLRKARGLTLESVGQAVGVGRSTVRKWENGIIANMRRDKIKKLATALGTTPSYIMGWTDDPDDNGLSSSATLSPTPHLQALADALDRLNEEGQEKLLDYAADLVACGRYKKVPLSLLENKNTAAARSGDRMNVASVSVEEEEAALPSPSHQSDI